MRKGFPILRSICCLVTTKQLTGQINYSILLNRLHWRHGISLISSRENDNFCTDLQVSDGIFYYILLILTNHFTCFDCANRVHIRNG